MCYDIQASVQAQIHRAKLKGDDKTVDYIKQILLPKTDVPLFCKSGFEHPKLLIYIGKENTIPEIAHWGLIPSWIKNEEQKVLIQNKTLNARIETLNEKKSFRNSVNNRGILYIDGFFEHHHFNRKAYPFFISSKNEHEPLALGCIFSKWYNGEEEINTFSIVTTQANQLVSDIQNKPSQGEFRMPLILSENQINVWLSESIKINSIINKFSKPANMPLRGHPVRQIKGKNIDCNVPEISKPFFYPELAMVIDDILVD